MADHDANTMQAAHAIVLAAKSGDVSAQRAIAAAVAAADAGDPVGAHVADALDKAAKRQVLDFYAAHYQFGAGVAGAPRNTGSLTNVGALPGGACGCGPTTTAVSGRR